LKCPVSIKAHVTNKKDQAHRTVITYVPHYSKKLEKLEREKRHNAVCDIAALNKISKQSGFFQDQPTAIK
jgi:hypothetical protein